MRPRRSDLVGLAAGLLALRFGFGNGVGTTDVDAALRPAWNLAHRGSLALNAAQAVHGETVAHAGRLYSDRPVGMILASMPGQLLAHAPSRDGALITAAALTALTVAGLFRLWLWWAWPSVVATPLLWVLGRTLWPETVGVCALVWLLLSIRRGRVWPVAPLVAAVTLCRPPLGLLLLVVAVVYPQKTASTSRGRFIAAGAAGFLAACALLVAYAHAVFGAWSPAGGYPVTHVIQWQALALGLFSPARGLLLWSPWVVLARPGAIRRGWLLIVAAVAYTVGCWVLYDAWGGDGWAGYRYAVPLAVLLGVTLDTRHSRAAWALSAWSASVGAAVWALQGVNGAGRHWQSPGVPLGLLLGAGGCAGVAVFVRSRRPEWWSRLGVRVVAPGSLVERPVLEVVP